MTILWPGSGSVTYRAPSLAGTLSKVSTGQGSGLSCLLLDPLSHSLPTERLSCQLLGWAGGPLCHTAF